MIARSGFGLLALLSLFGLLFGGGRETPRYLDDTDRLAARLD